MYTHLQGCSASVINKVLQHDDQLSSHLASPGQVSSLKRKGTASVWVIDVAENPGGS